MRYTPFDLKWSYQLKHMAAGTFPSAHCDPLFLQTVGEIDSLQLLTLREKMVEAEQLYSTDLFVPFELYSLVFQNI